MKKGDLVLVTAPTRNDYAIFVEHLNFDRMVSVEIIKETIGKAIKPADQKGIKLITKQKYVQTIFTEEELKNLCSNT